MTKYLLILNDTIFDQVSGSFSELFRPFVISNLSRLSKDSGFTLVLISPSETDKKALNTALDLLSKEGVKFKHILTDQQKSWHTLVHKNKPSQSVLISSSKKDADFARETDIDLIYFSKVKIKHARLCTTDWRKIYRELRFNQRKVTIKRTTSETDIVLRLNIDGRGKARINSPLGFLNHMLELLAKHSAFDIDAKISGDTHVDEHHTVEDTAIVLGQALHKAIADKRGISRYGFLLPMDEARIETAIDLSGRSYLTWKAKFKREKIGDIPTELFYHFFKSFTDHARCTLYVRAKGKNEHHIIEGIFKAVGRSLGMAVRRDSESNQVPSTKGSL